VGLLTDLRDLVARRQDSRSFEVQMAELRARHSRKTSFLASFDESGVQPARSAR
jgi:hypothetical protein